MKNPYKNLEDYCFWSRVMSAPAPFEVDPCTESFKILPDHQVVTLGSCFAQHLAKNIKLSGLNYFVPESGPLELDESERARRNFGVFSARYGNVYTVRQLVQLFDRAFGQFTPDEQVWRLGDRFVDPYRPQIEPGGFESEAELVADRDRHLAHVRQVFTESNVVIFTLGLTEGWRSKSDGAVFPIAPGVSGGVYDPFRCEFVNFTAREVEDDLEGFIARLKSVNPRARIILTVSPVALAATYERRHVWASTTVSKAALRVAVDSVERRHADVYYFPSYEIITSPAGGGRYYADDLREVTPEGVAHVMRIFGAHFYSNTKPSGPSAAQTGTMLSSMRSDFSVVCDEEAIERSLLSSIT